MKLTLKRDYQDTVTYGNLYIEDDDIPFLVTLERPDLNNAPNISCIPEGMYHCKEVYSPHFRSNLYELQDVPNRTKILIHWGNFVEESLGCILLGMQRMDLFNEKTQKKEPAIILSKKAYQRFKELLGDNKEFTLEITHG
jgi:hypothetical protein